MMDRFTTYKNGWCVLGDGAYMDDALAIRGEAIDRLAAYEDAEEQGLLVRLPCKVGDMVYRIAHDEDGNPYFVKDLCVGFSIGLSGDLLMVASGDRRWSVERFGKSIFCTREEAEAALKERRTTVIPASEETED